MGITTVMFDFDGTLANTNQLIIKCFQHTYRTYTGEEMEAAEFERYFGETLATSMAWRFGEKFKDEAMEVYRSFHRDRFDKLIEPFPGMKELVKDLKREGYQTALVTSRLRDTTLMGLNHFGLVPWFDCITTIDKVKTHKPDPESIHVTLETLGVGPEEAIMIGDTKFDIMCARNANCKSILVDWSVAGLEEREQMKPDFIAKSAGDIFRIIKRI